MLRRVRSDAVKALTKKIHFLRYIFISLSLLSSIRYGVTANITAFHAVARGSIPRTGICPQHCVIFLICLCYTKALQILTPIGGFVFYSRLRCLKMFLYMTPASFWFYQCTTFLDHPKYPGFCRLKAIDLA